MPKAGSIIALQTGVKEVKAFYLYEGLQQEGICHDAELFACRLLRPLLNTSLGLRIFE